MRCRIWAVNRDAKTPVRVNTLEPKLRTAPMAALVVIANLVTGLHSEPVGCLAVLSGLACELFLDHE